MTAGMILLQGPSPILAGPGTLSYRSLEGPTHRAVLRCVPNVDSVGTADSLATNGTAAAYVCKQLSDSGASDEVGPVLMVVAFDVPSERAQSVERWYAEEHIPLLCRAPGWLRARRYELLSHAGGARYTSIALHELRNVAVLDSKARAYARATAWRASMSSEAWFVAAGRFVYERDET